MSPLYLVCLREVLLEESLSLLSWRLKDASPCHLPQVSVCSALVKGLVASGVRRPPPPPAPPHPTTSQTCNLEKRIAPPPPPPPRFLLRGRGGRGKPLKQTLKFQRARKANKQTKQNKNLNQTTTTKYNNNNNNNNKGGENIQEINCGHATKKWKTLKDFKNNNKDYKVSP